MLTNHAITTGKELRERYWENVNGEQPNLFLVRGGGVVYQEWLPSAKHGTFNLMFEG